MRALIAAGAILCVGIVAFGAYSWYESKIYYDNCTAPELAANRVGDEQIERSEALALQSRFAQDWHMPMLIKGVDILGNNAIVHVSTKEWDRLGHPIGDLRVTWADVYEHAGSPSAHDVACPIVKVMDERGDQIATDVANPFAF